MKQPTIIKECRTHGQTVFVLEKRGSYRCKKCRVDAVATRRRRIKEILVEDAGGACVKCGYSKYIGALDFHHSNPDFKEFQLSNGNITSLTKAREEASKCILLCANCHREEHGMVCDEIIPT